MNNPTYLHPFPGISHLYYWVDEHDFIRLFYKLNGLNRYVGWISPEHGLDIFQMRNRLH
jgi:hypothetical protein